MGQALGLRKLLFVCFVVVSIVPVSFLEYWVQRRAYQAELSAVEEQHLLLAKNLSSALSRYATDLQTVFTEKSELPQTLSSEQAQQLLEAFNINLFLCVREGQWVYKKGHSRLFSQEIFEQLARQVEKARQEPQRVIFSPVLMNPAGEPTIYLLRVNSLGNLAIAAVATDYFRQVQEAVSFGELGHAAIVDQLGQAIAHPDADWQATAKDMSPISAVQAMMRSETDVAQFYSPALKADMIAGHTAVPETGWGVMIPQPISELEDKANRSRNVALLISAVGLLFAGGISWQLARLLVAPLQLLIVASRQLSQGEVVEALNFEGVVLPREFSALAQAFNQMAGEVSQSRLLLEEKVAERTQALRAEVEERRRLEEQLREAANHDSLTGLPNRRSLVQELEEKLLQGKSLTQASTTLLFIDLDGFKRVNDTFGHKTGDELLICVARRVATLLPDEARFYRLGGDEFVITLHGETWTASHGMRLSQQIITALSEPFSIEGRVIRIGSSIGVRDITPPAEGVTVDDVLADADTAMYQAKVKRNCVVLFNASRVS